MRIANADQFLFRHDHERIGALNAADAFDEIVAVTVEAGLCHQVEDDLAINGGLENRATRFQLLAQLGGVCEIAVVGDGNLSSSAIYGERLGVLEVGGAGGGVPSVADGHLSDQIMEDTATKNLRH